MREQRNNRDEIDEILYKYFEDNKEIPYKTAEVIKKAPHKKIKKYLIGKVAVVISAIFLVTAGIALSEQLLGLIKNSLNEEYISSMENNIKGKNYIQNLDMNYIELNDEYKVKVDHLSMDNINLNIVFNVFCSNGINESYRMVIPDLEIYDSNNNCIFNSSMQIKNENALTQVCWASIESEQNEEKRELFFGRTNEKINLENINIKFTKIVLYDESNPSEKMIEINCDCDFNIEL